MKNYKCINCYYCEFTTDYFVRWCSYWKKIKFLTGGCSRKTTVADSDFDGNLDLNDLTNFIKNEIDKQSKLRTMSAERERSADVALYPTKRRKLCINIWC